MKRHNWRTAFLAQSKSDLQMLVHLLREKQSERCHRLHYFLMAAEKLAKGYLTNGQRQPQPTHEALVRFLRQAHLFKDLRRRCRMTSKRQFGQYLAGLLPIAHEAENLIPRADTQKPNPEYPWQTTNGAVHVPCEYPFSDWGWDKPRPKIIKLAEFLESCLGEV
jgi:hypothetical protein